MPLFKKANRGGGDAAQEALVPTVAMAFGVQGFSMREATGMAIQLVEEAVRESRAAGGGHPPGYGDEIVRKAHAGDPAVLDAYNAMLADGVTDDDIRWYWKLSDIEKRVIDKMANQARAAHFLQAMDDLATEHPQYDLHRLAELAAARGRKIPDVRGSG